VSAGESCSAELAARWAAGRRFVNAYGPTEATVCATSGEYAGGSERPSIGRPLPGVRVHILGEGLTEVPAGEAGEIYIGGAGVARGYLHREELTAERFVPDPWADEAGDRLYRTGDLARLRADGSIEFVGRTDHQVKIRGFRIEPGEIEAVLGEHPAVGSAVVVADESGTGDVRLVAYVAASEGTATTSAELRDHLALRLPEHMIPAVFVILAELPLTPNGKVDRQALPAPEATRNHMAGVAYVAPRSETELTLAAFWSELLGVQEPGVDDDFFLLGGHSLLATRLLTMVGERLGIELPLRAAFDSPTIAGLASVVDDASGAARSALPRIGVAPRDEPLTASFSQEQVWFIEQLSPGNKAFNAQVSLRLKGHLDVEVLKAALTEIIRRHEMLRTSMPAADGRPVLEIHPPFPAVVDEVDLQHLPPAQREAEANRRITALVRETFDITQVPLVRWTLLRLAPDDQILLHVEHHVVHDGWSFAVFVRELKALYDAYLAGESSPLAELPIQFADYARWERDLFASGALEDQFEFWARTLANAPAQLHLPTDRRRPKNQSMVGAARRVVLPPDLYESLRVFARGEGVTLFMTLLAAMVVLLHRYSGDEDIVVGSSVANRRPRETECLIGMMVNVLALRYDLSEDPTFREMLGRVRQTALDAFSNQDVPFDRLVQRLGLPRDLSRNPLFQVAFNFHDSPVPDLAMTGISGEVLERQNGSAKGDLSVTVIPRAEQRAGMAGESAADEKLVLVWEWSTDLFDDATVDRIIGHYENLLRAVIVAPEERIGEIRLLESAEREALLAASRSGEESSTPIDVCLHDLFESQVRRTPDALAVVDESTRLTYKELDESADRLAARLRRLGVGPGVLVGLCTDRSLDPIVAMLAILKA
ncbi:MAG TPA: condensation domain-containing protein, partial [Acidimicrobiales bacterium]|nr:condensation domain-containing protein [Acidimicrobiales bacterium]